MRTSFLLSRPLGSSWTAQQMCSHSCHCLPHADRTHLEGSEHLGTSGGPLEASVHEGVEWTGSIVGGLNVVLLSVSLLNTLVGVSKAELGQHTASQEQTDTVGGGVVLQAHGETVLLKLVGVGAGNNHVSGNGCVYDLAHDILEGEADDQAVLVGVVLVLVLAHQPQAGTVVGLTLPPSAVLDLETTEVGRGLDDLWRGRGSNGVRLGAVLAVR